jgi:hypothetical protein
MRWLTALILFVGIMNATSAFAHDGHTHIFGTIATLGERHIVVKTKDGKNIPISVTGETTYRRQPATSGNATPQIGDWSPVTFVLRPPAHRVRDEGCLTLAFRGRYAFIDQLGCAFGSRITLRYSRLHSNHECDRSLALTFGSVYSR